MATSKKPPTIAERRRAALAFADLSRLNALDELWTGELAKPRKRLTARERGSLRVLGEEIQWLLDRVAWRAEWIADLAERRVVPEPYFPDLPIDVNDEARMTVLAAFEAGGGLEKVVRRAAAQVIEREEAEQALLTQKLTAIEEGEWTPGDLSPNMKCGVLMLFGFTCVVIGWLELAGGAWIAMVQQGCFDDLRAPRPRASGEIDVDVDEGERVEPSLWTDE